MGEVEEIYRESEEVVDKINRAMHSKELTETPLELPNDIHLAEDETVIAKDHGVVIENFSVYDGVIFLTNYRVIVVENNRAEYPITLEFPLYSFRVVRVRFESGGIFGKKVHTLGFARSAAGYLLCILLKNQDPRLWESEIIKHKQSSLEQLKKKIKNLEEFLKTQSEKMPPTPQNFLLDPNEEVKLRAKAFSPEVEEYFPHGVRSMGFH